MTKLDFEWNDKANESRAEYRGLIIRAIQDSDCSNPWKDSDGYAPLLWYSDSFNDESGSYDIESPLACFSNYKLARLWPELCSALDVDSAELGEEAKREARDYSAKLGDVRREKLEERLSELKPSGSRQWSAACAYFDALERLWRLAGVEALDFQRNGYSQGDSVRGLLVALPAWREAMGIPAGHDMRADLEAQADVFGAWAFGDCYGFSIERPDADGDPDGDSLDSVWGFIGDNFEKSGLAESALEAAESILASAAKRKADKLKELIRNHVPLHARPAILAAAGELQAPRYV